MRLYFRWSSLRSDTRGLGLGLGLGLGVGTAILPPPYTARSTLLAPHHSLHTAPPYHSRPAAPFISVLSSLVAHVHSRVAHHLSSRAHLCSAYTSTYTCTCIYIHIHISICIYVRTHLLLSAIAATTTLLLVERALRLISFPLLRLELAAARKAVGKTILAGEADRIGRAWSLVRCMGSLLADLSITRYEMLAWRHSVIAAACVRVTCHLLNRPLLLRTHPFVEGALHSGEGGSAPGAGSAPLESFVAVEVLQTAAQEGLEHILVDAASGKPGLRSFYGQTILGHTDAESDDAAAALLAAVRDVRLQVRQGEVGQVRASRVLT